MNRFDDSPGFYGKLPSHGDFISRRLPRQFIEPWDQWLQGGLAASREQLGADWRDIFLVSPIWQFALAAGLCGNHAWAGVMMPSVDRVGRYFPLTLAARVDGSALIQLFNPKCTWFERLSALALSTLDYTFELQAFDTQLASLRMGDVLVPPSEIFPQIQQATNSLPLAVLVKLNQIEETPQAFEHVLEIFGTRDPAPCSYWRSLASEHLRPSLLVCEGMPPIEAYVGFLNGAWSQRGWRFSSCTLPMAVAQPTTHWQSHGLSVVGLRRQRNEDAILDSPEQGLWAVADGMGGHNSGAIASQTVVKALAALPFIDDLEQRSEQVSLCLQGVNQDLWQLAKSRGQDHIIGSTVVVLLIAGKQFRYLWAGDSRLYRYRQGELTQLTLDHSLYNESIGLGVPPLDGSVEQGRGNVITRAVGGEVTLLLDSGQGEILAQDLFILCSDGLDKELAHHDIAMLCSKGSVSDIAKNLVREAENRGGRDNISVVVGEFT